MWYNIKSFFKTNFSHKVLLLETGQKNTNKHFSREPRLHFLWEQFKGAQRKFCTKGQFYRSYTKTDKKKRYLSKNKKLWSRIIRVMLMDKSDSKKERRNYKKLLKKNEKN